MILLLDNFDSFTYNLVDYFNQLGVECVVKRNDVSLEEIVSMDYDGLVISPGPETPQKSGNLMQVLKYFYDKTPVLGICLGHQAIGEFFGAKLVKALKPMHGKISKVVHQQNHLFEDIPITFNVVRYNSLLLEEINTPLKVIAETDQEEIMAICHQKLPVWGVQFHPEAALTEYGLQLLKNWLTL